MPDQERQLMKRLEDLCQWIREGKVIEAMYEFYDDNVEMQENLEPPCVGLEANVEREKKWLEMVKEFKGYEVQSLGVGGNTTFQECTFNYVTVDDKEVFTAQIARAIWKNNKIVSERFYWHP
jgi:hypothetical protein